MRPPFIALCGYPKCGKSTVQNILSEFGFIPVDDGRVLRDIGKMMFGLGEDQVSTQEGKAGYVDLFGKQWQVRDILGTLGNILERTFGEYAVPAATIRNACSPSLSYSFGSVRKNQGLYYKSLGGIVIQIDRKGCHSDYDFDQWNKEAVDFVIDNNGSFEVIRSQIDAISRKLTLGNAVAA